MASRQNRPLFANVLVTFLLLATIQAASAQSAAESTGSADMSDSHSVATEGPGTQGLLASGSELPQKAAGGNIYVNLNDIKTVMFVNGIPAGDTDPGNLDDLVFNVHSGSIVLVQNWTPPAGVSIPHPIVSVYLLASGLTKSVQLDAFRRMTDQCSKLALVAQARPSKYLLQVKLELASASDAYFSADYDELFFSVKPGSGFRCKVIKFNPG